VSISLSLKTWLFRYSSTSNWSNEALMLSYSATGDQLLLSKLYDVCGNDLYHFLLTLSDPTLAKDISQLTWLRVMEKKHLYRDSGLFKAWLFTLARNLLIDEYRRQQKFVDDIDTDTFVAPDSILTNDHDRLQRFNLALDNLPFVQREAFCLQQEMFSLEDIATITHNNIETVKSRLRYAKDNLHKQLKDMAEEQHV
jgi:RNA polymerase sigma factor (sigma-70 family)